jgi:hypothetical protein
MRISLQNATIRMSNARFAVFSAEIPSQQVTYDLDLYTGSISAAFSIRKLTGSANLCMRVRRGSDNATQDVGFQSDGLIDTGSLLSFVGASTGFVNVWYNQANILDNAVVPPGTTIQEPYIVLSGNLVTLNGKPAIGYNGLAGIFSTGSNLTDGSGLWSTYAVGQVNDTSTRLMVRTIRASVTNIAQNIRRNSTNIEAIGFNDAGGTGTDLGPTNPGTSQFLAYSQRTSTNVEVYVNNATNGATTVSGTPPIATDGLGAIFLGFFGGSGPPSFPWLGHIQEVIHYTQNPTTFNYRNDLSTAINQFYNVY